MMLPTYEALCRHALLEAPSECCGVILRVGEEEVYQPCANVAEHPESEGWFREEDLIHAEERGEVLAMCHSHNGSPEPGPADLRGVNEHQIPWFIVGKGGELQRVDPIMLPLEGRQFQYGWTDCYTLIRDWFLMMQGVRLPDFPREVKFWEQGHSPYLEHFASNGFEVVNSVQPGDLILMRIRSEVPNHAAVYIGEGRILHHLWGRLSACDLYNGSYQKATTHILRHV